MQTTLDNRIDLESLVASQHLQWNLPASRLYEEALRSNEGHVAEMGALVATTGSHTGRSPNDKFIVRQFPSADPIAWGKVNQPLPLEKFEVLYHRMLSYIQTKELYVQDCFAGADPAFRLPIRVITERAWHSLFARNLFIRGDAGTLAEHPPQFTVIDVPSFKAVPEIDGTRSEVFIIINFEQRVVILGGTEYAGEIKKAIFTVLNY